MNNTRIERVRSLVLDMERLRTAHSGLSQRIFERQKQLLILVGSDASSDMASGASFDIVTDASFATESNVTSLASDRAGRGRPDVETQESQLSGQAEAVGRERRQSNIENHVELLLDAITAYPDLRSEQLQSHVGLTQPEVKVALARCRKRGLVKVTGERRSMTYAVEESPAPDSSETELESASLEAEKSAEAGSEKAEGHQAETAASTAPGTSQVVSSGPGSSTAATSDDIVERVRVDLSAAYEGRPVSPDRLAFRLKADPILVDAALAYLVMRREARTMGSRGRIGYIPALPR